MEPARLTLRKAEKLRHRSLVERLFREGRSIYDYPLRLCWKIYSPEELQKNFRDHVPPRLGPVQMLVTVPKKKRKKAVDRVLMRRRIREAYRLQRLPLKEKAVGTQCGTLSLAFIYLHNDNMPYSSIEAKMKSLLDKLQKQLPSPLADPTMEKSGSEN